MENIVRRNLPADELLDNRSLLLKRSMERGLSPIQVAKMVKPMRGKTNAEKEAIAEKLIERLESGWMPGDDEEHVGVLEEK